MIPQCPRKEKHDATNMFTFERPSIKMFPEGTDHERTRFYEYKLVTFYLILTGAPRINYMSVQFTKLNGH